MADHLYLENMLKRGDVAIRFELIPGSKNLRVTVDGEHSKSDWGLLPAELRARAAVFMDQRLRLPSGARSVGAQDLLDFFSLVPDSAASFL